MVEIVFWIALAIAVGFWADSKGRNGVGWGIIATIISPLLASIILFFLLQKDQVKADEANKAAQALEVEEKKRSEAEQLALIRNSTVSSIDFSKEIEKYFNLAVHGLLTSEEFIAKKSEVIGTLRSKEVREPIADFLSALIPLVKNEILTQEEIAKIKKYVM